MTTYREERKKSQPIRRPGYYRLKTVDVIALARKEDFNALGRRFAEAGNLGNHRQQALLLSVMRMMALRSLGGKKLFDKFRATFGYIEVGQDALDTPNLCVYINAVASKNAKQIK